MSVSGISSNPSFQSSNYSPVMARTTAEQSGQTEKSTQASSTEQNSSSASNGSGDVSSDVSGIKQGNNLIPDEVIEGLVARTPFDLTKIFEFSKSIQSNQGSTFNVAEKKTQNEKRYPS